MSVETATPERLAMLLHHYREALAPDFGLRRSACTEFGDLSQQERSRMIAAMRLALLDLQSEPSYGGPCEMLAVPDATGGSEGKECGC
ncbi:MAG: hypothetical protein ABSD13_03955 [Candidatus Korobacteraceae bacterium]|jgi:hypothetical protein